MMLKSAWRRTFINELYHEQITVYCYITTTIDAIPYSSTTLIMTQVCHLIMFSGQNALSHGIVRFAVSLDGKVDFSHDVMIC